jgi:hypothetical protein
MPQEGRVIHRHMQISTSRSITSLLLTLCTLRGRVDYDTYRLELPQFTHFRKDTLLILGHFIHTSRHSIYTIRLFLGGRAGGEGESKVPVLN